MSVPREWLETDGLGGFAMGTAEGPRTRRYHSLLTVSLHPPVDRFNLVPGLEVTVETPAGAYYLTAQQYAPDTIASDINVDAEFLGYQPWPRWRFTLPDGTVIEHELFMAHGQPTTVLSWRLAAARPGVRLTVRPFLAARDYHGTQHENAGFQMQPRIDGQNITWSPYGGPTINVLANARYEQQSLWYRGFAYAEEKARGLDFVEDLAAPGIFQFDLSAGEAALILSPQPLAKDALPFARQLRSAERMRRAAFTSPLHRSAADYLVRRGDGRTVIAGYPWFADWGRDTFIALRGLCLAAGNITGARDILLEWAPWVSEGMLPNRFPDSGQQPEYNTVDASLWYIIAVRDLLAAADAAGEPVVPGERAVLLTAVEKILEGYSHGTRYGIRMDSDGLIAAGEPGSNLTWMDAKIGDWVVTPRTGKPVEIQALWIHGLRFAATFNNRWRCVAQQAADSFRTKFWNPACQWLNDVVDVEHQPGRVDSTLRPNQLLAVGGLGECLIPDAQARAVVDAVEAHLITPLGPRTLPPTAAGYRAHYEGSPAERDSAYHQGTVWPWLMGPFIEAWLHVHGTAHAAQAREQFLVPLVAHLAEAGLGHVSEIADADAPHTPRGCPWQAWSVGELIRAMEILNRAGPAAPGEGQLAQPRAIRPADVAAAKS